MDIKKLDELETHVETHKKIKTKLKRLNTDINKKAKQRSLVEKSINHEKTLRKFPSQAIGSVVLYNRLNENYSYYDDGQFNKIIRFVQHIEEKEKRYRELYVNCTKDYVTDPEGIPIKKLSKEQQELNYSYQLLTVLANEINGDVVSFNKVYNKLEDTGMFMTVPEKQNQEYLKEISSKLDNVMHSLKALFATLQETNRKLEDISDNTLDISSGMYDIESELWGISAELSSR
jgi:DNA repair exonuclease SbcCD ATPase subunit